MGRPTRLPGCGQSQQDRPEDGNAYDFIRTISKGAYGIVYECTHRATGQRVAIKRFKTAHVDRQVWQMSMREARVLQRLPRHPNIIELQRAVHIESSGRLYFVFECMERSLLQETRLCPGGALPAPTVKLVAWQLLQALAHCHSNKVVHRDVKPANVLLSRRLGQPETGPWQLGPGDTGGRSRCSGSSGGSAMGSGGSTGSATGDIMVKLCDFGLARWLPDALSGPPPSRGQAATRRAESTRTAWHQGDDGPLTQYVVTRWYRPPEVLVGGPYSTAVDIWSFGCTLAEVASGFPLFPGASSLDQLWRITRCLGPLPPGMTARMRSDPGWAEVAAGQERGRSLAQRVQTADPHLLDLIAACLALDPRARLSAKELLSMPYFDGLSTTPPPRASRHHTNPSTADSNCRGLRAQPNDQAGGKAATLASTRKDSSTGSGSRSSSQGGWCSTANSPSSCGLGDVESEGLLLLHELQDASAAACRRAFDPVPGASKGPQGEGTQLATWKPETREKPGPVDLFSTGDSLASDPLHIAAATMSAPQISLLRLFRGGLSASFAAPSTSAHRRARPERDVRGGASAFTTTNVSTASACATSIAAATTTTTTTTTNNKGTTMTTHTSTDKAVAAGQQLYGQSAAVGEGPPLPARALHRSTSTTAVDMLACRNPSMVACKVGRPRGSTSSCEEATPVLFGPGARHVARLPGSVLDVDTLPSMRQSCVLQTVCSAAPALAPRTAPRLLPRPPSPWHRERSPAEGPSSSESQYEEATARFLLRPSHHDHPQRQQQLQKQKQQQEKDWEGEGVIQGPFSAPPVFGAGRGGTRSGPARAATAAATADSTGSALASVCDQGRPELTVPGALAGVGGSGPVLFAESPTSGDRSRGRVGWSAGYASQTVAAAAFQEFQSLDDPWVLVSDPPPVSLDIAPEAAVPTTVPGIQGSLGGTPPGPTCLPSGRFAAARTASIRVAVTQRSFRSTHALVMSALARGSDAESPLGNSGLATGAMRPSSPPASSASRRVASFVVGASPRPPQWPGRRSPILSRLLRTISRDMPHASATKVHPLDRDPPVRQDPSAGTPASAIAAAIAAGGSLPEMELGVNERGQGSFSWAERLFAAMHSSAPQAARDQCATDLVRRYDGTEPSREGPSTAAACLPSEMSAVLDQERAQLPVPAQPAANTACLSDREKADRAPLHQCLTTAVGRAPPLRAGSMPPVGSALGRTGSPSRSCLADGDQALYNRDNDFVCPRHSGGAPLGRLTGALRSLCKRWGARRWPKVD